MSLFDVLKYPIGTPPTVEQICNVPASIFDEWFEHSDWKGKGGSKAGIGNWYQQFYFCGEAGLPRSVDKQDLELLRKLIEEYDEPI